MACDREGVDQLVALRVRVVAQRAYRTWGEKTGELILIAMDETGWLSLVGLTNRGFLAEQTAVARVWTGEIWRTSWLLSKRRFR
jgi:hypothetical protein